MAWTVMVAAVAITAGVIASSVALIGLGLDTWLGWWWAVPVAGLGIAALAVAESIAIWRHH